MIEVHNSHIRLTNYTLGDSKGLERLLSVWDSVRFEVSWANMMYLEDKKELRIPGGFPISSVRKFFPYEDLVYSKKPTVSASASYKCDVKPKDDKQKEAIDFLTGSVDETANATERMLCLQTGGGKTYCTIHALSKIKKRSMIVVDQEKIMLQWRDEFIKFTNLTEDDIYLISGRNSVDALMKKKKSEIRYKVIIAMHQTLGSLEKEVTDLYEHCKIGVNVFDEAHCYAANMFNINFLTDSELTIYLTATPNRSKKQEDDVYQASFKNVPKYGLEDKFDSPYHNIYYISYDSKPSYNTICSCQTKRGFDTNRFSDYTFDKSYDIFYEVVLKLLKITLKNPAMGKTCIIVHKNDHLTKLKTDLEADFPDIEIGVFSSLISDGKKREKELNKKVILSTDKSMGKAVNCENLQFIIMAVPTSSLVVAEQTLGRLRKLDGKKVMYFDVIDRGFKTCSNQRTQRRKILDKKACSINILDL